MKQIGYYTLLMMAVIIVLPFIIVRGCDFRSLAAPSQQEISNKSGQDTASTDKSGTANIPGAIADKSITLKVYISSLKTVREMDLEEYVKGVVAAEMPVEFEQEALKAQAVAARTYAYSRYNKMYTSNNEEHPDADVCTDYKHCQAWMSKDDAIKAWNSKNYELYWDKITKAVYDTKGVLIVFQNEIINAAFHSNSGGKTENIENVWSGSPVQYLRSVESQGEEDNSAYKNTVAIKYKDFIAKMKAAYPTIKFTYTTDVVKDIKIIDRTEGNRVANIKIGNITIRGTDFREIFSLKSANFSLEKSGTDSITVTTIGNGHGVGMSQWGANSMAKEGKTYEDILKYYYQGVELLYINDILSDTGQ